MSLLLLFFLFACCYCCWWSGAENGCKSNECLLKVTNLL